MFACLFVFVCLFVCFGFLLKTLRGIPFTEAPQQIIHPHIKHNLIISGRLPIRSLTKHKVAPSRNEELPSRTRSLVEYQLRMSNMKLASAMLKATWMMKNRNIFSAVGGSTIMYCVSYTVCSMKQRQPFGASCTILCPAAACVPNTLALTVVRAPPVTLATKTTNKLKQTSQIMCFSPRLPYVLSSGPAPARLQLAFGTD